MRRYLIVGAMALAAGIVSAVAYDFTSTGSFSGVPASTDKWNAPATPAGHLVSTAGVHSVYAVEAYSKASTGAWLKIYDTATTPTCGSGTPIKVIAIPAASTSTNLGGNNVIFGLTGFSVSNGIGYCVTGDIADNDTTAITVSTIVVNTDYR